MPRKGYRSLTLPENVYQKLISASAKYGASSQKLIEALLIDDNKVGVFDETFIRKSFQSAHQAKNDGVFHGACTVQVENLDRFREWLGNRKGVSEDTIRRYLVELKRYELNSQVSPDQFLSYNKWGYLAFRNYIHFRYQMGLMGAEEKVRWLDLLKMRRGGLAEPPEVKEEDVRKMMMDQHEGIVDVLYWSGVRITEAAYLGNNTLSFEDLGSFRRYAVGWARGNKRCDYAYVPDFVALKPVELDFNHLHESMPMLPKMLRKFFYRTAKRTALENRADPLIADFYQSRVSRMTVGERHYGELRSEADQLYPKVMEALKPAAGCTFPGPCGSSGGSRGADGRTCTGPLPLGTVFGSAGRPS